MYGHMPPRPHEMAVTRGEKVVDTDNKVVLQDLDVKLTEKDKTLTLHVRVALPQDAKGPVPVIVQSGFGRRGGATGQALRSLPAAGTPSRNAALRRRPSTTRTAPAPPACTNFSATRSTAAP